MPKGRIWCCAVDEVEKCAAELRPWGVISLSDKTDPLPAMKGVDSDHHLIRRFADVVHSGNGHEPCSLNDLAEIVRFANHWLPENPLLVHCWRGIGRSPAIVFTLACSFMPWRPEAKIAAALYGASPSVRPNRLIVAMADAILGRGGRMIAAIERFGDGDGYGDPFFLEID